MIDLIDHDKITINSIGKTMQEEQILSACMEKLRAIPPVKGVKKRKSFMSKNIETDAFLELSTDRGDIVFSVEVKGVLKRPIPQHLALINKKMDIPLLLMSEYINPSIAQELKTYGIHYIDCQGNAYINIKEYIYLDIQVKRNDISAQKKTTTLFQPTGMQLLFVLLAYPNRLNATLRELKKLAGISFGQTQAGITELKKKNLIFKKNEHELHFLNRKSLLEKWLGYYADRLRPKLILGSYKIAPSIESEILQKLDDVLEGKQDSYAIGGSLGADLLIHYYRGPTTELFIQPDLIHKVQRELKLMEAKETNLTLFNLFSPLIIDKDHSSFPVAHPLLIYAELLQQNEIRAHETAEMIYNHYLRS